MPLLTTKGAASATAFGFTGGTGPPSFLGILLQSAYVNLAATSVAADTESNVIIVGQGYAGHILKYSASGDIVWAFTFAGNSGNIDLNGVTTDSSNNIYVVGKSGNNAFIAKLNSSGSILWQKTQNPGSSNYYTRNFFWQQVKIDSSGNVNVVGTFNDNVQYHNGEEYLKYDNGYIATAQYNSSGVFQWGRKFGVISKGLIPSLAGFGISLDGSGNIYVSGSAVRGANSGGLTGASHLVLPVLKYNSSGTQQWGYLYRDDLHTSINEKGHLVTDSSGNSYIVSTTASDGPMIFKINSDGTLQWSKVYTSRCFGIGLDLSSTSFYVASMVTIPGPTFYNQAGLTKISSAGSIQFIRHYGAQNSDGNPGIFEAAKCLTISPDSNMVFGGPTGTNPIDAMTGKLKTTGAGLGTHTLPNGRVFTYAIDTTSTLVDQQYTRSAATETYSSASSDTALVVTEGNGIGILSSQSQTYSKLVIA